MLRTVSRPIRWLAACYIYSSHPMKKSESSRPNADSGRQSPAGRGSGTAVLNAILKTAYRRHARGRVALAAVTACLGR